MAGRIFDTIDVQCRIDSGTIHTVGVFGSQLINGKISLFLDSVAIIEAIEPAWFSEKKGSAEKEKTILCVDDSIFYQKLITSYLRGGLKIVVANNGKEALDTLEKQGFDGVICDIEMPVMDGFEFAKQFRSNPKYREIPLLAISAGDEEQIRPRALDCGFNSFKSKSNLEGLLETVSNLFVKAPKG
jgi:two-component system chemotaxis sensor kinase CheA